MTRAAIWLQPTFLMASSTLAILARVSLQMDQLWRYTEDTNTYIQRKVPTLATLVALAFNALSVIGAAAETTSDE